MSLATELLEKCRFPPAGEPVVAAVSGGADSLALLALSSLAGCAVTAVHVDHGQRSGSATEADVVRQAARRFSARFVSEKVTVAPGPNLEARLRRARWSVLPPDAATGHTADDRAETVLLNVLRGTGLDGLVAMEGAYHPIIALRRTETRALCEELGLDPVIDPSNSDPRFRRNRVRHELLPLLDSIAQRDVAGLLARQSDLLTDDAAFLDELAVAIDATDARALAAAPRPLARRAVRRWIASFTQEGYVPSLAAVDRVLGVAAGCARACEVGEGLSVRRTGGRLRVVREAATGDRATGDRATGGKATGGTETGDRATGEKESAWV